MKNNLPIKIDLPEHFLEEEVRCEYTISTQMKKVWAVELDLLSEVNRICEKYNLTYYADGGTLLGAVRHNGYIPWDDDIDLSMMRADYDKFCEVALEELQYPYFLSTERTEKGVVRGHAQVRNSATTAILSGHLEKKYSFNQGVFIDIFPLDNIPAEKQELEQYKSEFFKSLNKCNVLGGTIFNYVPKKEAGAYGYVKHWLKHILYILLAKDKKYDKYVADLYDVMTKYRRQSTGYIGELIWLKLGDKHIWRKKWYRQALSFPFEMTTISVPIDYDAYLQAHYGDWHQFVKGGSFHGDVFFDTEKSYVEYTKC